MQEQLTSVAARPARIDRSLWLREMCGIACGLTLFVVNPALAPSGGAASPSNMRLAYLNSLFEHKRRKFTNCVKMHVVHLRAM